MTAINDSGMDIDYLAYLLVHDRTRTEYKGTVERDKEELNIIKVNGKPVRVYSKSNPADIKWKEAEVDCVIDTTGISLDKASAHFIGGAKKVILTSSTEAPIFIRGVNLDKLTPEDKIIACASAQVDCVAPLVKLINDKFGISEALATTMQSKGSNKSSYKKGRRAINQNANLFDNGDILARTVPEFESKITGVSFRVPTLDVSVTEFSCRLLKPASYEEIKAVVKESCERELKGMLVFEEGEVLDDYVKESGVAVFDSLSGSSLGGELVKLVLKYDEENGYGNRLREIILKLCSV